MATKKKSTVKPKPKTPPAPTKKSLAQKRSMEKAKEYRKRMTKIDEEQYTTPVIKKRLPNRVPPRIIKKAQPSAQAAKDQGAAPEIVENTAAIDLAAKIALAKKKSVSERPKSANDMIRLSRRPTTRDKGKNTVTFSKKDLAEFKKKLLLAREAALTGINGLKATGFNESDDREADGGDGTNQTLRLQALGQMGSVNRTIGKIEEALHRIEDGSYGVCTMCGQLIRKPRLINQPFVLTCMECQSEVERRKSK